ncbi:16662_t:CDS:1, partial [Dentiscutata erythropus]
MNSAIFKILLILSLMTQSFAWTLTLGGKVYDGNTNQDCTAAFGKTGTQLDWTRKLFSGCCVRLYPDSACKKQQIGYSCKDWKKTLSQNVGSFKVES